MNYNNYDVGKDKPIARKTIEIGRFVGPMFVPLGLTTTRADGTYDIFFSASPGGIFTIRDKVTKKELIEFTW